MRLPSRTSVMTFLIVHRLRMQQQRQCQMIHGSRKCLAILLKHSCHSCLGIASRTRFHMLRRSALWIQPLHGIWCDGSGCPACCVDFGGGLMPPYWKLFFDLLAQDKQLDLPLVIELVFPSDCRLTCHLHAACGSFSLTCHLHAQLCHVVFRCARQWIMLWERVRGRPLPPRDICSHSIFRKSFIPQAVCTRS